MVNHGEDFSEMIRNLFSVHYQDIKQVDDQTINKCHYLFTLFLAVPLFSNVCDATFVWHVNQ